jgi:ubiquitin-protein ligase
MNPRLRRLQSDYDEVRAIFSGHPHVRVEPRGAGRPPDSYHVAFQVDGLWLDGDQPAYREHHDVEIVLPRGYPAEKPYCVPLTPVFHPNVRDYFCIADYWAAGTTLVDVIAKLGDMLQWRIYNVASPLDAIAAKWAVEQQSTRLFPIGHVDLGVPDVDVTLGAGAGGDAHGGAGTATLASVAAARAVENELDDFVVMLRRG